MRESTAQLLMLFMSATLPVTSERWFPRIMSWSMGAGGITGRTSAPTGWVGPAPTATERASLTPGASVLVSASPPGVGGADVTIHGGAPSVGDGGTEFITLTSASTMSAFTTIGVPDLVYI